MTEQLRLRRGTPEDSRASFDLFLASATDLTERMNIPWQPDREDTWARMAPLFERLAHHAAEWWIAEDPSGEGLVGYARSIERGGLVELSEFFVRPGRQSAGIGRTLLARAFPHDRGEVRVIIATTDVRAQRRYYDAGTVARFPIASVEGPPRPVASDESLDAERLDGSDTSVLERIEAAVLEWDRGDEFRWLLGQREGYVYSRSGRPIGFGFVSLTGSGPVAALHAADQVPILGHLEQRAVELGIETLSWEVPMINEVAMRHLLGRGYRIDPFLTLLMSNRPFGSFDRFIGMSPPFML